MTPGPAFWIATAFRFLFRSGRITAALALMVVAAVSMLIFLASLAVGVNDAMIRNSVGLYSGHITGKHLPASLSPESLHIQGVSHVLKRVSVSGILSHVESVQPITLVGIDPDAEKRAAALWKKVTAGSYLSSVESTILVSREIADTLKVSPGGRLVFTALPGGGRKSLTASGIFHTGIDALDKGLAFCPLPLIEGRTDTWDAAVFLKEGVDPDSIISAYRSRLPGNLSFQSWRERMPDLVQLIELNYVSMGIVVALVFGVVSLGIACGFVIFIFKNLREYGILKAMGVSGTEMALLITSEVILMNLVGCGIGVLLGIGAVAAAAETGIDLTAFTSHNRYFTVSGVIHPRLTGFSLWLPPALAVLFGLVAAVWPAILVNRKKAADILRIV